MKFTIDSADLKNFVTRLNRVKPAKGGSLVVGNALVLDGIYFENRNGKLYLSTTNLVQMVGFDTGIPVEGEGFVAIGNYIKDILKVNKGAINFEYDGTDYFSLNSPTTRYRMKVIPASSFPTVSPAKMVDGESKFFRIPMAVLTNFAKKVYPFTGNGTGRTNLECIRINTENGRIYGRATDSFILSQCSYPYESKEVLDITIPAKALSEFVSFAECGVAILEVAPNGVVFHCGDMVYSSRYYDYKLPDFTAILDECGYEYHFTLNAESLVKAFDNIIKLKIRDTSIIEYKDSTLTIISTLQAGSETSTVFDCEGMKDKAVKIAVNLAFIRKLFNCDGDYRFFFKVAGGEVNRYAPIFVKDAENNIFAIMPIIERRG